MQVRRTLTAALLGASLVAAAPSVAAAGPGHHGGQRGGASQGYDRSDVPSRIATRLKRGDRALDRAADAIDDGNATGAASALKSVRTNLSAAAKSAKRRSTADNGPDSFYAVAAAQDNAIGQIVSLYDGADDATVSALTQTLTAAIAGRDDLVATIAGLTADQQSDYGFVLDRIDDDVADEIDAIDEALSDDTLSDQAKTDLTDARAKLVATQTTVQGLNASQSNSASETSTGTSAADDEDCPDRGQRGSRGSRDQDESGSSTQEVPAT